MLARFCHDIGYDPGGKWNEQVNAGMEHADVVEINESIINRTYGSDIGNKIRAIKSPVIKDPRFIEPHVLEHWIKARTDFKVLMLLRDTKASVDSRKNHPEWFDKPITEEQLNGNVCRAYQVMGKYGIPNHTITFPDFLDQYHRVWCELTKYGNLKIDKKRGKQAWESLVNKEIVHF